MNKLRLCKHETDKSDLWPFILDGSKHPIFRKRPPSSDTQGTIRYYVTWKAFEVIIPQMIHRITAGNAFTPWENQYVDVMPMESTPSKDKVAQAVQRRETEHVRAHTPTEKETIENQFEDAIVDGVPLLELDEANAEATDPEHTRDDHTPDGKISPSDQSSDAGDSGHLEKIPAAGTETSQIVAQEPEDAKTTHEAEEPSQRLMRLLR
ncbi:MAG: hypothetical protein L6R42_005441 [Xanthoria sp. 1 TBL-2021]|nr:MAG: hypothetical protein L6R42_005441 [Xanthoria sp. 1 TBL-2021]